MDELDTVVSKINKNPNIVNNSKLEGIAFEEVFDFPIEIYKLNDSGEHYLLIHTGLNVITNPNHTMKDKVKLQVMLELSTGKTREEVFKDSFENMYETTLPRYLTEKGLRLDKIISPFPFYLGKLEIITN